MGFKDIAPSMLARIEEKIETLQRDGDVRVVYACESGSRAWGFPSTDSDYDVRFLYLRPLHWYLSISNRRDVIEEEVDRELDLGGWDVRKALGLMRKGNAPLLEWLTSPIVYLEDSKVMGPIRALIEPTLLPESLCHHYLAQTRRLLKDLDESQSAKLKSYFYAMRCLLAAQWVIDKKSCPPMSFWRLLDHQADALRPGEWPSRQRVDELVDQKRRSTEQDRIPRLRDLEKSLWATHDRLAESIPKNPPSESAEVFDRAILDALRAAGRLPAGS